MTLSVIVAPVHTAFSTLATLRAEIPAAASQDAVSDPRLTRLLAVAGAAIADYIGPVALATYQDTYALSFRNGYVDARPLVLSVCPVRALVSIGDVAAADIGDAVDLDQASGIICIAEPLAVSDQPCDLFGWSEYVPGLSRLPIQYVAGYDMADADAPTLDPRLEQAAIEAVRYLLAAPRDPNIKSESVQGVGSTTYNQAFGVLPDHVISMLDPFHVDRV